MDALAIAGLAALILVKEAGVPIPVPGDLVVIGAGVALAATTDLAAFSLVFYGDAGGEHRRELVQAA